MKDLFYEVIVTDKHGKVIDRESGEARSWLVAWNKMLAGCFGVGLLTIVDIGGVDRVQGASYQSFGAMGNAGSITQGVMVGTGNTPVDIEDYALEAQIVHGVGAGQLNHLAQTNSSPTVDATSSSFTLTRQFLNLGGTTITVKEIGIYGWIIAVPNDYYACFVRDVLGAEKVVPDGGAITVIYTMKSVES